MQKKQGISLIVLSITILVMAILAATAIIALEDSGIIGRSKNTVSKQNQQEEYTRLQVIKNGILTDNFGEITVDEFIEELKSQGVIEETITTDEYGSTVVKTKLGFDVYISQDGEENVKISFEQIIPPQPLGSLITSAADYGKTVDYTVTVNGITYNDWRIYYYNNDYVYLISASSIGNTTLDKGTTVASLTSDELALYEKFRVGTADKYTLIDISTDGNNYTMYNCQAVAQLIKDYANFANTTTYGTNVVGAIGGPTLELLAAGWNAKEYTPTMTLTIDTCGYKINGDYYVEVTSDGLYVPSDYWYWLASPSARGTATVVFAGDGLVDFCDYDYADGVRPVVCLKSSIPATVGTGDYDFSLTK